MADLNFLGFPGRVGPYGGDQCENDKECTDALPADKTQSVDSGGKGWRSYCIENKCWTRPGGQFAFCRVSSVDNVGKKPWPTGDYAVTVRDVGEATKDSIDDLYSQVPPGTGIKWRLLGCLSSYNVLTGRDNPCPTDPDGLKPPGPFNSLPVP